MRIVICSYRFLPSIGGIEEVSRILAEEFVKAGHEASVVTHTQQTAAEDKAAAYRIIRAPRAGELLREARKADVFFHNNISLQYAWPVLAGARRWTVAHHTWIQQSKGNRKWSDHAKHFALKFARNISVSREIAEHLDVPSVVIANPYRANIFREIGGVSRNKDLIFVGRLVSDKGLADLIDALAMLKGTGLAPSLTIVGTGPEEARLKEQAAGRGLAAQIAFAGPRRDEELATLLNEHRLVVVPSRWNEPFGLVALEGIACGCVAVGSSGGGLKLAIGPCGRTFPNGDAKALASTIAELLTSPQSMAEHRAQSAAHLAQFAPAAVAAKYLNVFES